MTWSEWCELQDRLREERERRRERIRLDPRGQDAFEERIMLGSRYPTRPLRPFSYYINSDYYRNLDDVDRVTLRLHEET